MPKLPENWGKGSTPKGWADKQAPANTVDKSVIRTPLEQTESKVIPTVTDNTTDENNFLTEVEIKEKIGAVVSDIDEQIERTADTVKNRIKSAGNKFKGSVKGVKDKARTAVTKEKKSKAKITKPKKTKEEKSEKAHIPTNKKLAICIIIAILFVVLIAVGCIFLFGNNGNTDETPSTDALSGIETTTSNIDVTESGQQSQTESNSQKESTTTESSTSGNMSTPTTETSSEDTVIPDTEQEINIADYVGTWALGEKHTYTWSAGDVELQETAYDYEFNLYDYHANENIIEIDLSAYPDIYGYQYSLFWGATLIEVQGNKATYEECSLESGEVVATVKIEFSNNKVILTFDENSASYFGTTLEQYLIANNYQLIFSNHIKRTVSSEN